MSTALFTHESCADHQTPNGHPERSDRIRAVWAVLENPAFADLVRLQAPRAERAHLARAHDDAHLDALDQIFATDGAQAIDADTWASPGSREAALRAAGAVVAAVDGVLGGDFGNAFCAVRPPGHHAERGRAMGFCFYSNAAIGALHAIEAHGLSRVAILDFDVHHGNGTQDVVEREPRIFFGSSHQWPLYPGTGAAHETGVGNVRNLCLPAHTGGAEFRAAFEDQILTPAEAFRPELVIISAGFDAHAADPLAQLDLEAEDFAWATQQICALAARSCGGRVVSTLEGGYDLRALAMATAAHVMALMAQGAQES